jgi:head-tail adaptor
MIRPGKMRHLITLQRSTVTPNDFGTEVPVWAKLADLRAELVSQEAAEVAAETAGTQGRRSVTFRTRIFGGVTVGDRLLWKGLPFDVVGISGGDFPEGRALELKCEGAA